jgi:hypothetical protein
VGSNPTEGKIKQNNPPPKKWLAKKIKLQM